MKIVFATEDIRHGACIVRAVWPALWINKFTEHTAFVLERTQTVSSAHDCIIENADLLVCHKSTTTNVRAAMIAKNAGVPVIYDTDDYDDAVFGHFYPQYHTSGVIKNQDWFKENADGFTVASYPLASKWPATVIENGFDTTLKQFLPDSKEYITDRIKVAWGGSSTHARDITEFLKMPFLSMLDEHPIDIYFYGLQQQRGSIKYEEGNIFFFPQHPKGIEWYVHDYFSDASFMIAPLINDEFNDHRSTLKIVEAGIAGKTIICSDVASYRKYAGDNPGAIGLARNSDEWGDWFRKMIAGSTAMAEINSTNVLANYNAQALTAKRIKYFNEVING